MKKNLKNLFSNFIHRFKSTLSDEQCQIINSTHIFNSLSPVEIKKVLQTARIIKYAPGTKVFDRDSKIKGIYILTDGTISVNSYHLYHKSVNRVLISQISVGTLIGKNTHVEAMLKSNHTCLEALTDVTLVHLEFEPENNSAFLANKIEGFHSNIEEMIQRIANPEITLYHQGDVIFKAGDTANHIYILLLGKVKLTIPKGDEVSELLLNRGQIFGELSILRNTQRAATAIAETNIKLLAVNAEEFKKHADRNHNFKHILSSLQFMYRLPIKDKVEMCISDNEISGRVLTSIYNLHDGRIVIATKMLNSSRFSMITMNIRGDKAYNFTRGNNTIQLELLNRNIISIRAHGVWESIPQLCKKLLDQIELDEKAIKLFTLTGNIQSD